jgi:hypothetical protein
MLDVSRRENPSPMNRFQRTRLTATREIPIRYGLVLHGDKRSDVAADFWQEIQSGVTQLATGV